MGSESLILAMLANFTSKLTESMGSESNATKLRRFSMESMGSESLILAMLTNFTSMATNGVGVFDFSYAGEFHI
jgi:hypothetical protein